MPPDPIITLASSIQVAPGTYALLLGSGVSKASQVPIGWEVVASLARRAAVAAAEDPGDDPVEWYRRRFGAEVDYSRLLEELAPSQADRRALLEGFFEPTGRQGAPWGRRSAPN